MNKSFKGASALTLSLIIAGTAGIGSAHAASNAELEQRVQRLEQMLHERRSRQVQGNVKERAAETDMDNESMSAPPEQGLRLSENTTLKIGGYVKLDAIYSTSSDGPVSAKGRQFYIPSTIPVGDAPSYDYTDSTVRQSRLNFTSLTNLGDHNIKGVFEVDFYGSDGSDALSGDYAPRLRKAFVEVDDTWLLGQTSSNFMDPRAFPETLDFFASNEGIVYARQPQVRYTNHNWTPGELSFSLENPYNSISVVEDVSFDGTDDRSDLPEASVSYTQSTSFGHLSLGALVHEISAENMAKTNDAINDDTAIGYGVRLSGTVNLGGSGDKFGFSGTYGDGLGRYLALGIVDEGYIDNRGNIEAIPYFGGYAYLRHYWSPKWRSNLVAGIFNVDNDDAQGVDVTKKVNSVHANLLWNPLEPITLGIEYAYAKRKVESGADGQINRVQASAKYAF